MFMDSRWNKYGIQMEYKGKQMEYKGKQTEILIIKAHSLSIKVIIIWNKTHKLKQKQSISHHRDGN